MKSLRPLLLAAGAVLSIAGAASAQMSPLPASTGVEPNTTGPVNKPMITEIDSGVFFINEFGADSMFLVVGDKRALAIDSGSGFCDFKAIIESLTKLPYDVVLTHGHIDHSGGIGQFDTVYMDPADVPIAKAVTYEGRVAYGHIMRGMTTEKLGVWAGYPNLWAYSDADVRKWTKFPEVKPIHEGTIFDLGGRRVRVYHVGNHTPGSSMFLDDKSRILFSGDAANRNVSSRDAVSTTLRSLIRIQQLRTQYDRMYTSHTAYANQLNPLPQDSVVLDDVIEAFRSVLRGNPRLEVRPSHLRPEIKSTVAIYGRALVGFDPAKLWEPGEAHVVP